MQYSARLMLAVYALIEPMLTIFGAWIVLSLEEGDHCLGRSLRQEERPLEIDRHHFIVAASRDLKEIHALPGAHACVVDQQVDPPEDGTGLPKEALPVDGLRHVGSDEQRATACASADRGGRLRGLDVAAVVDHNRPSAAGQRQRNPSPDPSSRRR